MKDTLQQKEQVFDELMQKHQQLKEKVEQAPRSAPAVAEVPGEQSAECTDDSETTADVVVLHSDAADAGFIPPADDAGDFYSDQSDASQQEQQTEVLRDQVTYVAQSVSAPPCQKAKGKIPLDIHSIEVAAEAFTFAGARRVWGKEGGCNVGVCHWICHLPLQGDRS